MMAAIMAALKSPQLWKNVAKTTGNMVLGSKSGIGIDDEKGGGFQYNPVQAPVPEIRGDAGPMAPPPLPASSMSGMGSGMPDLSGLLAPRTMVRRAQPSPAAAPPVAPQPAPVGAGMAPGGGVQDPRKRRLAALDAIQL